MFNLLLHCLTYFLSCTQTSLSGKTRVWVKFQMIFEFELWFSGKQSNLLLGFIGFIFWKTLYRVQLSIAIACDFKGASHQERVRVLLC